MSCPALHAAAEAGTVVHVLDRGNGRQRPFRKDADFAAFERVPARPWSAMQQIG